MAKITREEFSKYMLGLSKEMLLSANRGLEEPNLSKEEAAFMTDIKHATESYLIKRGVKISDVIGKAKKPKAKEISNESSGN